MTKDDKVLDTSLTTQKTDVNSNKKILYTVLSFFESLGILFKVPHRLSDKIFLDHCCDRDLITENFETKIFDDFYKSGLIPLSNNSTVTITRVNYNPELKQKNKDISFFGTVNNTTQKTKINFQTLYSVDENLLNNFKNTLSRQGYASYKQSLTPEHFLTNIPAVINTLQLKNVKINKANINLDALKNDKQM